MAEQYDWEQHEIIHCPIPKCKGMLLSHNLFYHLKCSDCEKRFMLDIRYIEITELEEIKKREKEVTSQT